MARVDAICGPGVTVPPARDAFAAGGDGSPNSEDCSSPSILGMPAQPPSNSPGAISVRGRNRLAMRTPNEKTRPSPPGQNLPQYIPSRTDDPWGADRGVGGWPIESYPRLAA